MDLSDYPRIRRDRGLMIHLPWSAYYEENRQELLRVDNDIYFRTGWWRFKRN